MSVYVEKYLMPDIEHNSLSKARENIQPRKHIKSCVSRPTH